MCGAEPANAGIKGPDLLSPRGYGEKQVPGWQFSLGSFKQDQTVTVPYMQKEPVLANWLQTAGKEQAPRSSAIAFCKTDG